MSIKTFISNKPAAFLLSNPKLISMTVVGISKNKLAIIQVGMNKGTINRSKSFHGKRILPEFS